MTISARTLLLSLAGINLGLMLLHLTAHLLIIGADAPILLKNIAYRFDMDGEVSIPTWFSQALLLCAAALFGYLGLCKKYTSEAFVKTWWFLAALFLFASIDEGSSIHELTSEPLQQILGITGGPFFFAWVILGLLVFVLLCACLFRFFLHLPRFAKSIFACAALSLLGALGVEMLSGAVVQATHSYDTALYRLLNIAEEGLENTAWILTIYGLLRLVAERASDALSAIKVTR